jgi:hypothetical protein
MSATASGSTASLQKRKQRLREQPLGEQAVCLERVLMRRASVHFSSKCSYRFACSTRQTAAYFG